MSSTPPQGDSSQRTQTVQQQTALTNSTTQVGQQPNEKQGKKLKATSTPGDGLATSGLFVVLGIFIGYFPAYSHTPAIQGLCLTVAYTCYAIAFLGGCFEIEKLAKSQFWSYFGIGIIGILLCLGANWLADLTNGIYALSLIVRICVIMPLALAAYGILRGILYLVIRDPTSSDANQQIPPATPHLANTKSKGRMKPEQAAGIVIAVLSVLTALIQALPTLLQFIKQLLHVS